MKYYVITHADDEAPEVEVFEYAKDATDYILNETGGTKVVGISDEYGVSRNIIASRALLSKLVDQMPQAASEGREDPTHLYTKAAHDFIERHLGEALQDAWENAVQDNKDQERHEREESRPSIFI